MPTVAVDKEQLYEALGRNYTTAEFEDLCFDFGIELDEDTTETVVAPERPQLKIDIPANRYDMLCIEGIARALNLFNHRGKLPKYELTGPHESITVDQSVSKIRPYIAGAMLRGIKFDQPKYDSFMALQEKLHSNICRNRTLVAIGTHDFAKCRPPFRYEARRPEDIQFVPLNQTKNINGSELMTFYQDDRHLAKFLPIIKSSDVYPIVCDSEGVCSLPPIINSERTKITMDTKDVFIEATSTDKRKLEIVMNIMVTMFSEYTDFSIEPVEIVSKFNNYSRTTPNLDSIDMPVDVSYINQVCGLDLKAQLICDLLRRMSLQARPESESQIVVSIPPTRADILHPADIVEDVAIAYGYNKLDRSFPARSATVGKPLPMGKLADIVRVEMAMSGWTEIMPLILCSEEENFDFLRRKDDNKAIKLANPKTIEYQVIRTSLIPGILKTIRENKHHKVPMSLFEVGDVTFKDSSLERGARNERHACAIYCGKRSAFEIVQGLLDRIMMILSIPFGSKSSGSGYWLEPFVDPMFFSGRSAQIHLVHPTLKNDVVIGTIGVLHPEVVQNFGIPFPCTALEFEIESFL